MKFFASTLIALSVFGAASAATCSSSMFAGQANLDDVDAAINIVCANPGSQDADIDMVSGRDGHSLLVGGTPNIKLFISARGNASKCINAFNDIKNKCVGYSLKYGRVIDGRDYYSITAIPGNSNEIWI